MQAQATATKSQVVTHAQSLAMVQALLKTGLGCITFLRDLLPTDNFTKSYFMSPASNGISSPYISINGPQFENGRNKDVHACGVTTIIRGFTEEADRLLDYLENGIFDALQKRYLRSFIFAIYLDPNDPSNIVEAYTFNFKYHTISGTNTVIPIMTVGNTTLNGGKDPAAEALKRGETPTVGDVKNSVKAMIKRLIQAATSLDTLPKQRFATFKLYYTEETPEEYEPPNFQPGDAIADRWFFTTHEASEQPERWDIGAISTGHHAIDMNITSVAGYLPASCKHDKVPFTGLVAANERPTLSPIEEAALREKRSKVQLVDANSRNFVWAADGDLADDDELDAEGEINEDYERLPNGEYVRVRFHGSRGNGRPYGPVGWRNEKGDVIPLPADTHLPDTRVDGLNAEAQFHGLLERVPNRVSELSSKQPTNDIEHTQQLELTQEISSKTIHSVITNSPASMAAGLDSETTLHGSLPPSSDDPSSRPMSVVNNAISVRDDAEMLDLETQARVSIPQEENDTIETFGKVYSGVNGVRDEAEPARPDNPDTPPRVDSGSAIDKGLNCECGISVEDQSIQCEAGCGRWYHVWCMGYHSAKDLRMPLEFTCFDCRVRGDTNWQLLELDVYPRYVGAFKDLALFRRAIKIAELKKVDTEQKFAKAIGCGSIVAHQLFGRLITEEFIKQEITSINEIGLLETQTIGTKSKAKAKGRSTKQRKNTQKPKYVFVKSSKNSKEYANYFNPKPSVENELLDLPKMIKEIFREGEKARAPDVLVEAVEGLTIGGDSDPRVVTTDPQSQTQEETQVPTRFHAVTADGLAEHGRSKKRKSDGAESRPGSKKTKLSVVLPIDLGA